MFTEIGNEGTDCCPELTQSDALAFQALRWILMSLRIMKDPESADDVVYLPEDSDLSEWHIELVMDWLDTLELVEKKDRLERADLIVLLQALGHCPNEEYLEQMLEELSIVKKTTFTFGDTCFIWQKFIEHYDDELKLLQKAFQFFDKDNNGGLSVEEFRTANRELGNLLTDEEIMSFVEIVDVTQDGDIQYDELLASLMTQYTTVSKEVLSRQTSRMQRASHDEIEDAMTSPSEQQGMSRGVQGNGLPGIPADTCCSDSEAETSVQPECMEVDGGTFQALILHTDSKDRPPEEEHQSPRSGVEGRPSTEHLVIDHSSRQESSAVGRPVRHESTEEQSEITRDERHVQYHSYTPPTNHIAHGVIAPEQFATSSG